MKSILQNFFLLIAFWLLNFSVIAKPGWYFSSADVNALHSTDADFRIFYGTGPQQFADLRLPKNQQLHPVAIIIHGGCWMSKFADLKNTAALADALREIGFATWNLEYRREDNEGGGWPGTFEDIANGVDFLRTISSQYALDLDNVLVIGHSAGGHLALWLAGRSHLLPDSSLYKTAPLPLRGVIALGGVPDLKAFRKQGEQICGADVIGKLLGKNEQEIANHYEDASPIHLLPLGMKQILIYGTDDNAIPDKLNSYIRVAKKSGDPVKLIYVKHAGHHEYNVPNSVTWPIIKSAVELLIH